MGRKSTPTAIRKLRGDPSHRPSNTDEPSFETAIPDPPAHLDGLALIEWTRITSELATKNVISTVDMAILALYCAAFADWSFHSEQLKNEDHFLVTPKGYTYINPRIGLINTLGEKLAKYAGELGITPSSRSKIRVNAKQLPPVSKKKSLADNLFGQVKVPTKVSPK